MQIWGFFSYFGDTQFWMGLIVISLLIYYILSRKERKQIAWIVLALIPAIILSAAISTVVKDILKMPRPCYGLEGCPEGYSLPSRHATVIFAFSTVVSIATRKKELIFSSFALAIIVSLSRVFLNYHTFWDITVGMIIGIVVGYLTYKIYKRFFEK
jgi:undecaprenyl-diphosphatase